MRFLCVDRRKDLFNPTLRELQLPKWGPMAAWSPTSIVNFKFQPDTGSIVIDRPDKGDYHFHILPPVKQ